MICAIVLAAGRSERMGRQKLLLPLKDRPIIVRVVDELLRVPVSRVLVVVGRDAGPIQAALCGREVSFVRNPDSAGDMLGSVRCGLRALPESCEAVLVALGDQPGLSHQLVGGLIGAFRESGRSIIVPAHGGRRGHPVLFDARFREEMLTRFEGVGLRGLLAAHPDKIHRVPVLSASALEDLDTPEDYQRHLNSTTD